MFKAGSLFVLSKSRFWRLVLTWEIKLPECQKCGICLHLGHPRLITHYPTFRSSFQAACDKNPINGNCCLLLNVVLHPREGEWEKTWQLWLNSWDYPYCCVGEKWGIKLISSILINTKNTDFCGLSQIKGKKEKKFCGCGWYKHTDLISLNLNDLVLTSANFLGVTRLVVPGFVTLSLVLFEFCMFKHQMHQMVWFSCHSSQI